MLKVILLLFVSKMNHYDSSSSPLASNKIANYEVTFVAIDYTCPFCNCLVQYCILLEVIEIKCNQTLELLWFLMAIGHLGLKGQHRQMMAIQFLNDYDRINMHLWYHRQRQAIHVYMYVIVTARLHLVIPYYVSWVGTSTLRQVPGHSYDPSIK